MLKELRRAVGPERVLSSLPTDAAAVLRIEVDGFRESLGRLAKQISDICLANSSREVKTATDRGEEGCLWLARRSVLTRWRR